MLGLLGAGDLDARQFKRGQASGVLGRQQRVGNGLSDVVTYHEPGLSNVT